MKRTCIFVLFALLLLNALAYAGGPEARGEEKMKPALLVIDIQNAYLPYMAEEDTAYALRVINAAISLFREHNYPIVRVYHTDPEYGPKSDTKAFEFPSSINIEEGDPKIIKNYSSAFQKTDLENILHDMECNTLFLCGLSAVGCVLATYHGGMERDFDVFLIKNALLSHKATYTDFVEEVFDTVSYRVLVTMLKYP